MDDERRTAREVLSGHALSPGGPPALYYQISQEVRRSIEGGELEPGTPLPSERELCEIYGVSRPTVRQATQELLNEGLLERRRGVGTYVAQPRIRQQLGNVLGFSERMGRAGRRPETRLLEKVVRPAADFGEDVVQALRVPEGARVLRLARLRLADGEPVLLETAHLPLESFPGLEEVDLEKGSLYRTLRGRYGVELGDLRQTLVPVLLGSDAAVLETDPERPGVRTALTTYDTSGRPVEYTLSLVRGDRCEYHVEFRAGEQDRNGSAHLRQTQLEVSFPI